jgi:hypothetical protein
MMQTIRDTARLKISIAERGRVQRMQDTARTMWRTRRAGVKNFHRRASQAAARDAYNHAANMQDRSNNA